MTKSRSKSAGFSLVEVVIAILLMAVVVTSIMGVILTAKGGVKRYSYKTTATLASKKLLDDLKNYVSADTSIQADGPGGSWSLPGDNNSGGSCGSGSGSCSGPCASNYALATNCAHFVDDASHAPHLYLPATFANPPISMTLCYCVSSPDTTQNPAQIQVFADWKEPQL